MPVDQTPVRVSEEDIDKLCLLSLPTKPTTSCLHEQTYPNFSPRSIIFITPGDSREFKLVIVRQTNTKEYRFCLSDSPEPEEWFRQTVDSIKSELLRQPREFLPSFGKVRAAFLIEQNETQLVTWLFCNTLKTTNIDQNLQLVKNTKCISFGNTQPISNIEDPQLVFQMAVKFNAIQKLWASQGNSPTFIKEVIVFCPSYSFNVTKEYLS